MKAPIEGSYRYTMEYHSLGLANPSTTGFSHECREWQTE